MTGTWTDSDLDAALAGLAAALDPDPAGADLALDRARARWAAVTPGDEAASGRSGPVADVLDLGNVGEGRPPRPTRWTTGLLVAAAVVAAVVLAAVFWPRTTDRAAPLGPRPSPSPTSTTALLDLLPQPLPPVGRTGTVITETSGVGDAVVPFTPLRSATDAIGNPITLTYSFVCGSPDVVASRPDGAPADPRLAYSIADNQGPLGNSACAGLADGLTSRSTSSFSPDSPLGRDEVRVDVASPDTVWKLTVTAASG